VRLGELFLFGFEPDNPEFITSIARSYGLGGVIIFERNLIALDKYEQSLHALRKAAGNGLLVAVDQEGGAVNRLQAVAPIFPSPRYYGERKNPDDFRINLQTTARHLKRLQINLNLVPICDVLTNPRNMLMRTRCFGDDPELVSRLAGFQIDQYHAQGIACCAKHFPGLGSAEIDPHRAVAVSEARREQFEAVHWPPFTRAINLGVEMIMTTHLLAGDLDADCLATYSRRIVSEILRRRLRFEGIIITDDLGMGALSDEAPAERARRALQAGHDMLMFCHNPADQESAFKAVLALADSGQLEQSVLEGKIARVLKLKQRLES